MSDWFAKSKDELIFDMRIDVGLTEEQARGAYAYLYNVGLIDYDIEKEVLWDLYGEELDK